MFKLGHNQVFTFSFVFYLILPPAYLYFGSRFDFSVNIVPLLAYADFIVYVLILMLFVFFWFLGQLCPPINLSFRIGYVPINRDTCIVSFLLFFFAALGFMFCLSKYGVRSGGYGEIDFAYSGIMATFHFLFFQLYLYASRGYIFLKNIIFVFYIFTAILLLMVGSRLYVISSLLGLSLYMFNWHFKVLGLKQILCMISVVLVALYVGVVRSGGSVESLKMLAVFLAEPIFTWWSVASFDYDFYEYMYPEVCGFLSLLINVIPRFVFPDKASYILTPTSLAEYDAPLGATSIIVSGIIYFGIPVFCAFVFLISSMYKKMFVHSFVFEEAKILYCVICSFLPFLFFRELLSIQIKLFLTFVVFVPLSVRFFHMFLKRVCVDESQS